MSDASGGHARLMTHGLVGPISPDGRWLAVLRGRPRFTLYLVQVSSGHATLVARDAVNTLQWAPDSRRFVVEQLTPASRRVLSCTPVPLTCRLIYRGSGSGVALSHDGASVALGTVSERPSLIHGGLLLTPGRAARKLPAPYDNVWLWPTAGVLMSSTPNGGPQRVALLQDDGNTRLLFTEQPGQAFAHPVDVSPDGQSVLYLMGQTCRVPTASHGGWACYGATAKLAIGPITGGVPRPLSRDLFGADFARFTANGKSVIALHVTPGQPPAGLTTRRLAILALPTTSTGLSPATHLLGPANALTVAGTRP